MLVYQRVLQSLCTWMSNPFALLDWNILKSLMPWYVSVANGFVKSHLFAPGCYGFSSPQRLYEKVSTHPHLNPHGCCLTFPLLHIRVCVKNRAPTKTHCLKPHCGIAGLDKPLYTDGEYAHLSLCWLIPLWLLVVEILCWTKPYRDASSFQLLVTFGGMNIHSSFRCSLLLFFFYPRSVPICAMVKTWHILLTNIPPNVPFEFWVHHHFPFIWRFPKMGVPPVLIQFPLWTIQLFGYHHLWKPPSHYES